MQVTSLRWAVCQKHSGGFQSWEAGVIVADSRLREDRLPVGRLCLPFLNVGPAGGKRNHCPNDVFGLVTPAEPQVHFPIAD